MPCCKADLASNANRTGVYVPVQVDLYRLGLRMQVTFMRVASIIIKITSKLGYLRWRQWRPVYTMSLRVKHFTFNIEQGQICDGLAAVSLQKPVIVLNLYLCRSHQLLYVCIHTDACVSHVSACMLVHVKIILRLYTSRRLASSSTVMISCLNTLVIFDYLPEKAQAKLR